MELPTKTAEYEQFEELTRVTGAAYGPFTSRRLGQTLGINLLGDQKVCSFDCPYCELGRTTLRMNQVKKDLVFPPAEVLIEEVLDTFRKHRDSFIQNILISGNGEPTLYPNLLEFMDLVTVARDEVLPDVPIVIFTNGVHLDLRKTITALEKSDEIQIKIDAGNEPTFKAVNNPLVRANIPKILSGTRKLQKFSIQSFFVKGIIDNTRDSAIDDWIEVVGMMQPQKIYLYSLKRMPPIKGLIAADEDTLYTIASKLKRRTQIEALVFA